MKREKALKALREFPEEFNVEELIEQLIFIDKIENARQQARQGKLTPHQEVKKQVKKW